MFRLVLLSYLLLSAFPAAQADPPRPDTVICQGNYPHHLQGICIDADAIYWSFTTTLVKTDATGKLLNSIDVENHHGDLCYHDNQLFVAVNLGKFNDPSGHADSWIYTYDSDLNLSTKQAVPQVFHGAGGIGYRDQSFFVVGGLPDDCNENYIYEYDRDFHFVKKHILASGHTHLGIQTATFAQERWWFGCYGSPQILLVADENFRLLGRYEFDCSLGIVGTADDKLLAASGKCSPQVGCNGSLRGVSSDDQAGLH